jgi:type VI secretion system protein VasG
MAQTNLKALIEKLNPVTRKALESAAGLCLSQTHYEVDVEHFLVRLLESENTDVHRIFRHFEIDPDRVITDLGRAMESFKSGNSRTPALSPRIPAMVREAWMMASVEFGAASVRSGHILLGLLDNPETARMVKESAPDLRNISVETLQTNFHDLTKDSEEAKQAGSAQATPGKAGAGRAAGKPSGERALDQFTINLTERAQSGEIDPVLGRDDEIRQMIDILIRRRQNNPILTGEAGVGKTAVVEGFALRIAEGDVPEPLKNIALHVLDLGLLQAGAGIKGEFENRLKSVIDEVKASPVPIILFIDEAHTLIGAGGAQGAGDAANLLKPALARGELRTIAATTWSEYKKYFEKDAALARRFQVVKIDEPDEPRAMVMMRAIAPFLEQHHQVMITDDAILDAVRLSHRYISGRQLPDKAVSVLDTACARVAIGLQASPPAMEAAVRDLGQIEREMKRLKRESLTGRDHGERMAGLESRDREVRERLEALEKRLEAEMGVAGELLELRQAIFASSEEDEEASPDLPGQQEKYRELEAKLAKIQGDDPLLSIAVDGNTVSEVVSAWTGIPTGRMLTDEIESVLALKDNLQKRIIGQDHALESIAQVVQTTHAGIEDPSKPTGVFMMVGPSGVGKTETALALSELLYGGEQNLITINMSEYQEAHTVSGLKGSPPGYVGFGEGGVLTEAVRRRPYSVVLLDEIEKAHPDVAELFYQVFDKGRLEDGEGRVIDFKNTLIILTSNVGTDLIMKSCADDETMPDPPALAEMLRPELQKHFKPAFLGRLKVVPYYPITDENMRAIVRLKLNRIARRMRENRNVSFVFDDEIVETIASRCTEVDSGARNIDHILTNTLLPEMSQEILARMARGEGIREVKVEVGEEGFRFEISNNG